VEVRGDEQAATFVACSNSAHLDESARQTVMQAQRLPSWHEPEQFEPEFEGDV